MENMPYTLNVVEADKLEKYLQDLVLGNEALPFGADREAYDTGENLRLLRGLAADFPSREARAEGMDEAVLKSKEFKAGDHAHDFPPRAAPPAMTQLWLLRSAVRALSDDRSLFAQKSSLLAEPEVILRRLLVAVEALELRPLARAQLLPLLEVRRLGGSELG